MKILHAPHEIAGQILYSVNGLKANKIKAESMVFFTHRYLKNGYDINLKFEKYKSNIIRKILKLLFLFKAIINYNIFHFHAGRSLLGRNRDLPILKFLGKKIVMEYHGSEIRDLKIAFKKDHTIKIIGEIERNRKGEKLQKYISKHVDSIIVHDNELYEYLIPNYKRVEIIPLRFPLKKYRPIYPDTRVKEPLIVHSPSNRLLKGTKYIIDAVNNLRKKYSFQFELLENLTNEEVLNYYKEADLIIDQLIIGSYGTVSIEAMALGKPVLCYVRKDLLEKFPSSLPIFISDIDNIEENIETLIKKPDLRRSMGIKGREYVENYHDAEKLAIQLFRLYRNL